MVYAAAFCEASDEAAMAKMCGRSLTILPILVMPEHHDPSSIGERLASRLSRVSTFRHPR